MFKNRDYNLDFLIGLQVILGLFALFSINPYYFNYQLIFVLVGLIFYFYISKISLNNILTFIYPSFFVIIILLLYLFISGVSVRGSASWLNLGFISFQPSELSKFLLIFLNAYILSQTQSVIKKLVKTFAINIPTLVLVYIQPDFGTFFVLLCVISFMYFVSVMNLKWFLLSGILAVVLSLFSYFFVLQSYQQQRITSFFNPKQDTLGASYNVEQAKIAIGSGGFFGKGVLESTQVNLYFLPEPHTDFIFSAIGEMYGFVFLLVLMLVVFSILFRLIYFYLIKAKTAFALYYGAGVFALFFVHISLNIGMNLGLLPVTGLPLPFVSYGGSSLLTFFIAFGFLHKLKNL